jgi:putative ABC transport system substrate-binding protein
MTRVSMVAILTLALLAAPLAAEAQLAARVSRVGLLGGVPATSPEASHLWGAFFQGLRELGYVEGQNIVFEHRFYGGSIERLPALAAELARLPVDVIVAGAPPAPEAAKAATSTIPIVMMYHPDPVGFGLVTSLARPTGNVTGLSLASPALRGKQLELLKEAVPRLLTLAVLSDPRVSTTLFLKELEAAAQPLKVQIQVLEARAPSELAQAFSAALKKRADALLVLGGSMLFAHRTQIVELATKSRLPAMGAREFAEAGGLMAYGASLSDSAYRAAGYVHRILQGAKPADLPIEQPTKFELIVNLRTAKALGLTIPPSVLARADEVIE